MLTMNEMKALTSEAALLKTEGLQVRVKVLDVRQVFGRVDAKVTPINGSGETWIAADRLTKEVK